LEFPDLKIILLLVTFGAIRLIRGAESFLTIMASGTLGHFALALFHLEKLGMAVGAFELIWLKSTAA
jgi:hypothetical protein